MAVAAKSVLGLDVGSKRIGLALASLDARLAHPLTTLTWDDNFFSALGQIIAEEAVGEIVVGLPRGLQGQHTEQTRIIETFVADLRMHFDYPIHVQDEALTSRQAETELAARGKPYVPADIDALAATYILSDFLADRHEESKD